MLVLSRCPGESFDVDGPARITVLRDSRGRLRLGVTATQNVKVLRTELGPHTESRRGGDGTGKVASDA